MPYIIDGHNLIPKIPGLSLQALDDEKTLIRHLQSFCRSTKKHIEVYFDHAAPGQPRKRRFGMVTAFFISEGTTADSAIRSRLRSLKKASQNWTVVTSDRQVVAAAREAHSKVISSDEFALLLLRSIKTDANDSQEKDENISLSPDAVEDWLDLFNANSTKE